MSEKMRGAIFASLGDLHGLDILDAFSGSGALGIEAISRGANSVTSIEVDKRAHSIIQKNIKSLDLEDQIKAVRAYVNAWSTRHPNNLFDVVLADPPYDDVPHRDMKSLPKHLKKDGILVLSWPEKFDWYPFEGLEMFKQKSYGDSQLIYYKKASV
jgi:16S rRNA (guanine966-N2)-methyltransferase